ncbi:MAG: hypothetical protein NTY87_08165 [Planctomycetia bacterium]|nr:hypothetical protein [Planctomycetia bacterium]
MPCKLYGVLAAGRAIVAAVPEGSEVASVVHEEGCGLCRAAKRSSGHRNRHSPTYHRSGDATGNVTTSVQGLRVKIFARRHNATVLEVLGQSLGAR